MSHDQAWWAALLAALCSPSIPMLTWKGLTTMNLLFPSILKILSLLSSLIVIAEDTLGPGTGDQKKAKVISDVQSKLPGLAEQLGIPGWAITVFTNAGVLGILIDSLVAIAGASGHMEAAGLSKPTTVSELQ